MKKRPDATPPGPELETEADPRGLTLWAIAQWIGWVIGLMTIVVLIMVYVFTTFETKSDAASSQAIAQKQADERYESLRSDVRDIQKTVNDIYKMESGRSH